MKPATPQIGQTPSTQLRKAVFGGSLNTIITVLAVFVVVATTAWAGGGNVKPELKTDEAALQRFTDMRFGMLLQWSPAVLRNAEPSWSMGDRAEYEKVYKDFAPKKYNPEEWIDLATTAGMKYAIYVCKHHDGMSMWDTKTTDCNIMNTPLKHDVTADFLAACRKKGLFPGTYLSIADLHFQNCDGMGAQDKLMKEHPELNNELLEFTERQCAGTRVVKARAQNGLPVKWHQDAAGRVNLTVPLVGRDPNDTVIELTMDRPFAGMVKERELRSMFEANTSYGKLVSEKATLTVSSSSQWNDPAKYPAFFTGERPAGFAFHTGDDASPWAIVDLGSEKRVTGLAIENRGDMNGERAATLRDGNIASARAAAPTPLTMWWRRPGTAWSEAMILGNGRLGAMVSGGVTKDTIWLNEDTLWSGEPFVPNKPEAAKAYPEIHRLLLERKEVEADDLFNKTMLGPWTQNYLPLGNLNIEFPIAGEVQDYRRALDLRTGIASVEFRQGQVLHTRETFVSHPDQAMVTRITASRPGQVSFSASVSSLIRNQVAADGQVLRLTGRCPSHSSPHYAGGQIVYDEGPNPRGMAFAVELQAIPDGGQVTVANGKITASGCNSVTLILVAATSYNGFDKSPSRDGKDPLTICKKQGTAAAETSYASLKERHAADFSALMDRVSLDLGTIPAAQRSTDERIRGGVQAEDLPALTALYYQFGRYLLVSSSRSGSQPPNLQGIWNNSMTPPWACNWTMNCNANFNYLGIETANLSELHEPFIRLVKEWSVDGARTAKTWFGLKGWVGTMNCDLWRNACPVGGVWCAFPGGGAWACQDLWEHYAFTQDKNYLREVWPVMHGSAEFFLDFLVLDPNTGYLVTSIDNNFENHIVRPDGKVVLLCIGTTPSNMMVRQLFQNCIAASRILNADAKFRTRMEQAMAKLPPTVINPNDGEIQEFLDPNYKIAYRGQCQLLSAWGAIWADQITPRRTPELAAALRKAYEAPDRRPWIQGGIGSWQTAFPANTFARLGDGDRVAEILTRHFQAAVNPNFSSNFMFSEWQIDGNLGTMAAIGEMLLQSHAGEIELLPALPKAWKDGSVKGLKARGGITVDINWKEGKVTNYRIGSADRQSVAVRINGELKKLTTTQE